MTQQPTSKRMFLLGVLSSDKVFTTFITVMERYDKNDVQHAWGGVKNGSKVSVGKREGQRPVDTYRPG
jgi:hypothetical protein